jgi:hypothetical protein
MNTNPLNKGILTENFVGIGTVTPEMVQKRAVELALINGRAAADVSQSDWEQAKRELKGEPEMEPKESILESAPESERWDPVPGTPGRQAPESSSEDDDDEGRSLGERLVAEGVNEAEHDQMLQAAKDAQKEDQREP